MAERFRSPAARALAKAVRAAGGTVERVGKGKLRITGPTGSLTLHEPGGDTRRDLRSASWVAQVADATGLDVGQESR